MPILNLENNHEHIPPMDLVEQVIRDQGWNFRRVHDNEMAAEYRGRWCNYSLHFVWSNEASAFHFTCAFDVRIPSEKQELVYQLLALVNDKLWLGHFIVWQEEGLPMYRHSLPLRGSSISHEQIEDLLDISLSECERFYPTFQYVAWGGKPPAEALEAAIIDPIGEA